MPMKIAKGAALAGLLLAATALAGCVTVTSAPAGAYAVGGGGYQVTLGREWSDASAIMLNRGPKVRLLTLDGPLLNQLLLADGLVAGEFIVKPLSKDTPTPTYRAGMSAQEQVEFVSDSVAALGYARVETAKLRPGTFGDAKGVRFDLTAQTKGGLEISGSAQAAEAGGKLYVILYLAPTEHYFAATLPEVETIISSARRGA